MAPAARAHRAVLRAVPVAGGQIALPLDRCPPAPAVRCTPDRSSPTALATSATECTVPWAG